MLKKDSFPGKKMERRFVLILLLFFISGCATTMSDIEKYENKRNVEKLIRAINDKDVNIQCSAIKALGNIGDPKALSPLVSKVYSNEQGAMVIDSILEAITRIDGKRAIVTIEGILKYKSDKETRKTAVKYLGVLNDLKAVELLVSLLKDKDPDIAGLAVSVLKKKKDLRSVKPVLLLLRYNNVNLEKRAEDLLNSVLDESSIPTLISFLDHYDSKIREFAVKALIKYESSLKFHCIGNNNLNLNICGKSYKGFIKPKGINRGEYSSKHPWLDVPPVELVLKK